MELGRGKGNPNTGTRDRLGHVMKSWNFAPFVKKPVSAGYNVASPLAQSRARVGPNGLTGATNTVADATIPSSVTPMLGSWETEVRFKK